MNEQLYTSLGIDRNRELNLILDALEEKQVEYLERLEKVSDDARKKEISETLKQIGEEIENVKEKIRTLSSSLILDDSTEEQESLSYVRIIVNKGNIRSGAGKEFDSIGIACEGEDYVMTRNQEIGSNGHVWYEIYLDEDQSTTGWVSEVVAEEE